MDGWMIDWSIDFVHSFQPTINAKRNCVRRHLDGHHWWMHMVRCDFICGAQVRNSWLNNSQTLIWDHFNWLKVIVSNNIVSDYVVRNQAINRVANWLLCVTEKLKLIKSIWVNWKFSVQCFVRLFKWGFAQPWEFAHNFGDNNGATDQENESKSQK